MDAATSASFISTSEVLSAIRGGQPLLIIDVRREQAFRAANDMIAGALWRDPERVAEWAGELPRASRVVAYCVHGHEVSQGVAKALAARGLAAISLGLSRNFADDHEMLKAGMVMYDALYAWCKSGQEEVHTWNPAAYR